jgi:hypothetical protein
LKDKTLASWASAGAASTSVAPELPASAASDWSRFDESVSAVIYEQSLFQEPSLRLLILQIQRQHCGTLERFFKVEEILLFLKRTRQFMALKLTIVGFAPGHNIFLNGCFGF